MDVQVGASWIFLTTVLFVACQVRADVQLRMDVTTTSMSISVPELQLLIRNEGDEGASYKVQIRSAKGGPAPGCDLTEDAPTDDSLGNPWREYLVGGVTGSVKLHGFAHRIHAFRHRPKSPCAVDVHLSFKGWSHSTSKGGAETRTVMISPQPDASVAPTAIEPKISGHGWGERDMLGGPLLVHVIARNETMRPQTLAIVRRELSCKEHGVGSWNLLRDVPQGLSSGPVSVPPGGWAGFVSVVDLPPHRKDPQCVAFFDVAYERMPRAFAVITKVEVRVREDSGWSWAVPGVEWPE